MFTLLLLLLGTLCWLVFVEASPVFSEEFAEELSLLLDKFEGLGVSCTKEGFSITPSPFIGGCASKAAAVSA